MTCDELKTLAQSGRLQAILAEPDVRAHLSTCAECEALYAANAQVVEVLVAGGANQSSVHDGTLGFDPADLEALHGELTVRVHEEANDRWNFLRDRKTSVRRSVVLLVIAVVFGLCLVLSSRPDLARYPLPRLAIEVVLLFTLIGVAVKEATRTLVDAPRLRDRKVILVVCVAAPIVLAIVSSVVPVTETDGTANVHSIVSCLSWGTAVAFPAALALWLSKRTNPWEEARLPLLAATLGVVGNLLLQIHCPSGEFGHLICAHAPLLLVFALGFTLWGKVARNRLEVNRTPANGAPN